MNDEHQYYGANLNGEFYRKDGTENIFGTAQDNIYPLIASAGLYSSLQDRIGMEAFYQSVYSNKSAWGGKWKLAYMGFRKVSRTLSPIKTCGCDDFFVVGWQGEGRQMSVDGKCAWWL